MAPKILCRKNQGMLRLRIVCQEGKNDKNKLHRMAENKLSEMDLLFGRAWFCWWVVLSRNFCLLSFFPL